jgi:hypothetical protein
MSYTVPIDPEEILGVRAGASLEEIRAAYHLKVKKYHPDAQGDAWAFRIVTRAYEILGRARIAARLVEEQRPPARPTPPSTPTRPMRPPLNTDRRGAEAEQVRAGVRDAIADPSRIVDVEIFLIRYEIDDPTAFFLTSPEDRNLSCTLNLTWPIRRAGQPALTPAQAEPLSKALVAAFKPIAKKTGATASRTSSEDGRFSGWLTYPTAARTSEAFHAVHAALRAAGFGVEQRTRELLIPREDD